MNTSSSESTPIVITMMFQWVLLIILYFSVFLLYLKLNDQKKVITQEFNQNLEKKIVEWKKSEFFHSKRDANVINEVYTRVKVWVFKGLYDWRKSYECGDIVVVDNRLWFTIDGKNWWDLYCNFALYECCDLKGFPFGAIK